MNQDDYSFPYSVVPATAGDDDGQSGDLIVATRSAVATSRLAEAVGEIASDALVEVVLERRPLYWYRVLCDLPLRRAAVAAALRGAGVDVRYVASRRRGSEALGPALCFEGAAPADPSRWRVASKPAPEERRTTGRWFLGSQPGGVAVDRQLCGYGAGRRLAVIDDDAAGTQELDLDAEVRVGVDRARKGHPHGALMVAWATRTAGHRFQGVAPGASARLYLIPKPDVDVVSFPLAIVRAVDEGADVVVCATYLEGTHGPLLDDALSFARAMGRRGRGALVVLPTGREARGAAAMLHASFSLSLADPASDPRVLCVGPSGREGDWFLWKDRHGALHPFANRGPAVRLLAPGDDIAYPFLASEPLWHAESSGASAIAAGVALLVLSCNPQLTTEELIDVLVRTAAPVTAGQLPRPAPLADPSDVRPARIDPDGHNAKYGYGVVHAARACAAVQDPISFGLISIGAEGSARSLTIGLRSRSVRFAFTRRLGRHLARMLLNDGVLEHELKVLLRHVRLLLAPASCEASHPEGATLRHAALLLRRVRARLRAEPALLREIDRLERGLDRAFVEPASWDRRLLDMGSAHFREDQGGGRTAPATRVAARKGWQAIDFSVR